MEFKRTRPQEELNQERELLVHFEDGSFGWVNKDPNNTHYAQFLKMEAEGYEAWWHDEEIDWSQAWEAPEVPVPVDEPTPKRPRRKKTAT